MKRLLLSSAIATVALASPLGASAKGEAMMIAYPDVESIDNFQEYAAAKWFTENYTDGVIIAPGETSKINNGETGVIWIHIDRVAAGKGTLPAPFTDEATLTVLRTFVENGGCLYLSKQATQLLPKIGRTDIDINIYGDGDGGEGFDNWNVNAYLGYWQENPDNQGDKFPEQIYDHTGHAIYKAVTANEDFAWPTFPMLGTGDPTTSLWREDHNCMWDLNAYTYTAEGANTVEKFENQYNASVIGTWGHVQDYAVAGIVEFFPATVAETASEADQAQPGTIIANGLAACEWSPRTGVNAYDANLKKLTSNTLAYLNNKAGQNTLVDMNVDNSQLPVRLFTLDGIEVDGSNLAPGIYISRQGDKTRKFIVK